MPIPVMEEAFGRVIVDCVGPLPRTRSGKEYLLTVMRASTRYPEAIQSDQGSNFMSRVFTQSMKELGIVQIKSSAYHPESQGALERFHQTLKTMMKSYCAENEKDWDQGIPFLLFGVREVIQESLGFSPNELVFGHSVRGPLQLLKEKWLGEEPETGLLTYVLTFKDRLYKACEMAQKNLAGAQSSMKTWYDKKAHSREFKPGDQVLVLSPVQGSPLQAKYSGPYEVSRRVGDLNYVVKTPDRRKSTQVCHVNMLKKYHVREVPDPKVVAVSGSVPQEVDVDDRVEESEFVEAGAGLRGKLNNSAVLANLDEKLSHLDPGKREDMKALILEYPQLCSDIPTRTHMISHDVDVEGAQPIKQAPYRVNPVKRECLKQEVKYLIDNDFAEEGESLWGSPCILVPKPDKTNRFCTDYRKVNSVTKTDSFPIPRLDDCIDRIGEALYITKIDLLKGYYQIPLTKRAQEVSTFVTPDGSYFYKVMPFGMKNAPGTFQRLMNKVVCGLCNTDVYIDDLDVHTKNCWKTHLRQLRELFDRLSEANLTINLEKCEFGKARVMFLGHVVGQGVIMLIQAKVDAIQCFPVPTTRKGLMRFLGMAGFYMKFCKNFASVAAPLTDLLSPKMKYQWTEQCQQSFDKVKAIPMNAPVLVAPNHEKPFKLAVDASDRGIGSVLIQEDEDGIEHPVCYFSKKFNKHQRNYSTIEKETLALILSLEHFEVYVKNTVLPVQVFTDHNPLVFLQRMKNKNQKIMRWSLTIQEYNLVINHIKGKDNVIADALSRSM
jgi:hypothetical protein